MEEEYSNDSFGRSAKRYKKCTYVIWDMFEKVEIDGKRKAKCKKYGHIYSCEHGTSNMLKHMMLKHGEDVSDNTRGDAPFDQNHYRVLMGKTIIKHNLPYSFVEYDGIREVHNYLNPKVQPISRNTIKSDILGIYRIEKRKLRCALESVPGKICLTSDLWSSTTMDGYLSLTAHFVDEHWKLQSRILNLRFMPPPHSGELLAESVICLLKEWGIEKKVFTLTLDNASANNGLVEVVRSHLNLNGSLLCGGEFFHVRCGAHILNLIVHSGLKAIENCVSKVREIVKYIRGAKGRMIKFAKLVTELSINYKKKLCQDVPTRWNSTYLMFESALQYKVVFCQLSLVDKYLKNCPTEAEWIKLEKICEFLKPFYDITTLFSETQYSTSNLYFHGVFKIQSLINAEMEDESSILYEAAFEMNEKFQKYWECYSLILSFAAILDPRYKLKFVEYIFRRLYQITYNEKVKHVHDKLIELYIDYCGVLAYSSTPTTSCPNVGGNKEPMNDFDDFESYFIEHNIHDESKSQLDLYLEESKMDARLPLDVLAYWKSNQNKYTVLSVMARDILSIPITTVASESSFSTGGQIISKYRTSITPQNAEVLLCARNWLYGSEVVEDEEDLDGDVESFVFRQDTAENFT